MADFTYFFGNGRSDGNLGMRGLLGARGAHLCEMANLGLPVVPGFCITSKAFQVQGQAAVEESRVLRELPEARDSVKASLGELELATGRRFGHQNNPLLISVWADSDCSDRFANCVANLGLNDHIVEAWTATESPHFVWDSYRRLIAAYARVVRRLDMEPFENHLSIVKANLNSQCQLGREHADCHIPTRHLRDLVATYKELFYDQVGEEFPQDPEVQLWESLRAMAISGAPIVQATIFSNYDFKSGAGLIYLPSADATDDEGSLEPILDGGWLVNAQADDVSRSDRVWQHLTTEMADNWGSEKGLGVAERCQEYPSLEEDFPRVLAELLRCQDLMECHLGEAHCLEFAIDRGELWVLQPQFVGLPVAEVVLPATVADADAPAAAAVAPEASSMGASAPDVREDPPLSCADNLADGESPTPLEEIVLPELGHMFGDDAIRPLDEEDIPAALPLFDQIHYDQQAHVEVEQAELGQTAENDVIASAAKLSMGNFTAPIVKYRIPLIASLEALQSRDKEQKEAELPLVSTPTHDPELAASSSDTASRSLLKFDKALPLWKTALPGCAAGLLCCGTQVLISQAASSTNGFLNGLRSAVARGGIGGLPVGCFRPCIRAMPMGAICCTLYTNSCNITPADDRQFPWAPVWRMGCAASAATLATAATYPVETILNRLKVQEALLASGKDVTRIGQAGSMLSLARGGGLFHGLFPAMRRGVPGLAIELAFIDFVRNAGIDRGFQVSPGLLLASGAAAGTISQVCLHPVRLVQQHMEAARACGPGAPRTTAAAAVAVQAAVVKHGASSLLAGLGPACVKTMPVVALNSLVRCGLVLNFTS